MLSRIRSRFSYANVMASIAVFVALGGSSYAAVSLKKNSVGSSQIKNSSITGTDIKNSSVTSADIKDGTLLTKDFKSSDLAGLAGPKGATGAAGPQGPQGPKGDKGDAGRSALTPLQSGESITGAFNLDSDASGAAQDFREWIPFAIPAPSVPTLGVANTTALAGGDTTCTGTVNAPTAPAGKVCLYVSFLSSGDTFSGFAGADDGNGELSAGSAGKLRGFVIRLNSSAAGDIYVIGSYAYTAP